MTSRTTIQGINEPQGIERPLPSEGTGLWGSDVLADMLRALDIPYVALNPGASYRGLHDSLVNRLGNERPQMLLCLHEESAVAIAHGWAKVTGRPMAAIVHSNVGLMHASMAVFNAWCDRMPLLLFGATGPMDAAKRRPWIEWIHTAKDQGALIRNYTKWDDQPMSVTAAQESILRARQIAETAPRGPTYVCFDVALQEERLEAAPPSPEISRFLPPQPVGPSAAAAEEMARRLLGAERPLIFMGRVGRGEAAWGERVALAEALGAVVLTDLKQGGAFPSDHPLHGAPAGSRLSAGGNALLRQADVVLSLDWLDLAGALMVAWKGERPSSHIMHVSLDQHIHNGWSMDYQALPPVDLYVAAEPDATVSALRAALAGLGARRTPAWTGRKPPEKPPFPPFTGERISVPHVAAMLQKMTAGRASSLLQHPLSWAGDFWPIRHPLDFLGGDGGGGIGAGPGVSVGAALALRGTGRLPVAVLGDGDFIMGSTALWTAVHYGVPLLVVVANNRSYYNDEVHQERVALARGRPVENKWIGQQMIEPELDLAMLARSQGAVGLGPVRQLDQLEDALAQAIAAVDEGQVAVVDVRVEPGYYEPGRSGEPFGTAAKR